MRTTFLTLGLIFSGNILGCTSLDRRPLADKVPYMALQPVKKPGVLLGERQGASCSRKLAGIIPISDMASFEGAKTDLIAQQVTYMTDVLSYRYSKTFGPYSEDCLYLKGIAYR